MVAGIIRQGFLILGRAAIGAVAGLVVTTMTLVIASEYFHLPTFPDPVIQNPAFQRMIGMGMVGFAGLAVVGGRMKVRGRAGAIIPAALGGTIGGILVGWLLGSMAGNPKGGNLLGIFLGGPTGTLLGAVLGFENDRLARNRAASHSLSASRSESSPVAASEGISRPKRGANSGA